MPDTIVLQSHTQPLPAKWLQSCIDSVQHWSKINNFEYKFYDDSIFELIPSNLINKLKNQTIVATDLARIKLLRHYLDKKYHTVIWCDSDFLIFKPQLFSLIPTSYALGREVWIQKNLSTNSLISKTKVHNAFMLFRQNNNFLDFYIENAERLIEMNSEKMSPQFIGPKLLTALHNIIQCPVIETAGMLSPLTIKDINTGAGKALDLFIKKSKQPIYAANLCSSLYQQKQFTNGEIQKCITRLLDDDTKIFNNTTDN